MTRVNRDMFIHVDQMLLHLLCSRPNNPSSPSLSPSTRDAPVPQSPLWDFAGLTPVDSQAKITNNKEAQMPPMLFLCPDGAQTGSNMNNVIRQCLIAHELYLSWK